MDIDKLKKSTKKLKVLFVEDSLSARKITQRLLSQFFDFIDIAEDGKIGLDMYHTFYDTNEAFYDIVFTDLEMPNMNGKELSKRIIDFNPLQEIIVMSGINDFNMLIEIINVGVKKFIAKPVVMEKLEVVIDETMLNIRKRQLQEEDTLEVVEYNEHLKQREEENKALLEIKIQELEEFSHALDNSAIVAKTDPSGSITYVNDKFCKISGYTHNELIGQNHRILKSGARSSSYYKKIYNTLNAKRTYKNIFENKRKDGSIYYVDTTITPLLDVDGGIVEFIAVSHDMTQLMSSMESTRLAQKSKEDFFINMSHEMKTPLNSILGFTSLLQKKLKDDEKSLMMVNTIAETGNDLNNLVNSIIDMRKIQEGKLVLNEFNFNPKVDIPKALDKFIDQANEKGVEYKVELDALLPEVLVGDVLRITQVIVIVVDNAIKFTKNGGRVEVHLSYNSSSNILVCTVKDSGIGISKEDQKKIFGLEQLDASASRAHEGAGLGLNIASNIIKIMKGDIKLKSIPEKGSLFSIEIPLNA